MPYRTQYPLARLPTARPNHPKPRPRVLLAWSSGKDSAWALHVLRQAGDVDVVALLTTFNQAFDRVAMHAVRRELVEAQAAAAGLPLFEVSLPWPCHNEDYEAAMATALATACTEQAISHVAFGDLFLEDIRQYRESRLRETGLTQVGTRIRTDLMLCR